MARRWFPVDAIPMQKVFFQNSLTPQILYGMHGPSLVTYAASLI